MRRVLYTFALALIFTGMAWDQANAQVNLFWEEMGPNNQGNHTRAMAVDGNGVVWAGSVGGGLWKSTNQGSTWEQVDGVSENLAVSCIAVNGSNIYVGTGETFYYEPELAWIGSWNPTRLTTEPYGFHYFSGTPGEGVFVSTDGGTTWSHDNGTWNNASTRYDGEFMSIQKVESQGSRTFVATLEGLYYSNSANLATLTKSSGTAYFENNTIVDVEFANNNVVLAATRDSLYRSTDNGATFGPAINSAVPTLPTPPNNRLGGDRIEIEVAPSNPSTIYVTGASDINGSCTGVFKSTDNGVTFTRIAPFESATFQPLQNQGRYSLVMAVNPNDENAILLGGEKLYSYDETDGWIDAASHFNIPGFTTNYVPTPILSLAFSPQDGNTFYVGTDAEIVRTTDYGDTYSMKTKGFNNAHTMGVSGSPDWKILASDRYVGLLRKSGGDADPADQQFLNLYGNTGGGIARWVATNPNLIISQTNDGGLVRSFNNGEAFEQFYGVPLFPLHPSFGADPDSVYVDRADSASGGAGVYDAPIAPVNPWCLDDYIPAANLVDDTTIQNTPIWLYMCSRHFVWVCTNPFGGLDSVPHWNRISMDLVEDNFGTGNKEFFTAITVSLDNDHTVYVGTNKGKIFRIWNANDPLNLDIVNDVQRVDTGQGMPERWITDIEFDPGNRNNLVVTYGAYAQGDDRVWITNDAKAAGQPSFRSIQDNLDPMLPVYSAAFHPDPSQRVLLVGTEEGLYATSSDYEAGGVTWSKESDGFGNVPVMDITFRRYYMNWIDADNYSYAPDYTLFVATAGRGTFKSRTLVNTEEEVTFEESGINAILSPNPAADYTDVMLSLNAPAQVELKAYNIQGQEVALLADRMYPAGNFRLHFDASQLPSGIYLIKGEFSNSKGAFNKTLKAVITH